ncbi:hypothetical protein ACPXCG_12425 [Gordonia sp. DT218]|uniref:hypothetical protein n=1 Tax=Gordonia sp. DT218 TaxID=3416659 RepID=UPI003CF8C997
MARSLTLGSTRWALVKHIGRDVRFVDGVCVLRYTLLVTGARPDVLPVSRSLQPEPSPSNASQLGDVMAFDVVVFDVVVFDVVVWPTLVGGIEDASEELRLVYAEPVPDVVCRTATVTRTSSGESQ